MKSSANQRPIREGDMQKRSVTNDDEIHSIIDLIFSVQHEAMLAQTEGCKGV